MTPMVEGPRSRIEVVLVTGARLSVAVERVVGIYAIHPMISHGVAQLPGWSVSHQAAGLCIWSVAHYEEAVRVAEWLDAQDVIPEDPLMVQSWWAHARADQARLVAQLTGIAPRYQGPPPLDFSRWRTLGLPS